MRRRINKKMSLGGVARGPPQTPAGRSRPRGQPAVLRAGRGRGRAVARPGPNGNGRGNAGSGCLRAVTGAWQQLRGRGRFVGLGVGGAKRDRAAERTARQFDSVSHVGGGGVVEWRVRQQRLGVAGATLVVNENGAPNNPVFNRGVGVFEIQWIGSNRWVEGTGTPNTPTTDGVEYGRPAFDPQPGGRCLAGAVQKQWSGRAGVFFAGVGGRDGVEHRRWRRRELVSDSGERIGGLYLQLEEFHRHKFLAESDNHSRSEAVAPDQFDRAHRGEPGSHPVQHGLELDLRGAGERRFAGGLPGSLVQLVHGRGQAV